MKKNKYIKEIAKNLPVVMDTTVSGYYADYDENGEEKLFPNIVQHPINHERRIRKAYEQLGMAGVKQYLLTIYNLQLQHNENLQQLRGVQTEGVHVDGTPESIEDRPIPGDPDPLSTDTDPKAEAE